MPEDNIPLSQPDINDADIDAVVEVMKTPQLSLGPKLFEFEKAIATYSGCKHAVAVNSGTSALHLIVRALDLCEGDEVITSPFSFVASTNCLIYERVKPIFVDIDAETMNIDPGLIEAAITDKTKAILAIDIFGRPANWQALQQIARKHDLALIEDSCEALGARYRLSDGCWKMAGSLGDVGTFAFYPNKQMTTGEGGMIVTDSEKIASKCQSMRNQGRGARDSWLQHTQLGFNYRLSDINCALGMSQLKRLNEMLHMRNEVVAWYNELLADVEDVITPQTNDGEQISWFVYVIKLGKNFSREHRDKIIQSLRASGIGCANYFASIHLNPYIREMFAYKEGDFPITEAVSDCTLALPFYNRLTRNEVEKVVNKFKAIIRDIAR